MTTTDDEKAALHKRVIEAEARELAAKLDKHRALADLALLNGNEWEREYHLSFVAAQSQEPGGHERFMRLVNTRNAKEIIDGKKVLTDFSPYDRLDIAAEVARLIAEQGKEPKP